MNVMPAGAASHGEGSRVPGQSNSCSQSSWSTPHEITAGCSPRSLPGAAQSTPQPRGAKAHLCRLAAYQSTPSEPMSSAIAPGAWAPSASTATPRARHAAAMPASGSTSAVSELTWSSTASRVRGPIAAATASTQACASSAGNGQASVRTVAPRSRARKVAARVTPP